MGTLGRTSIKILLNEMKGVLQNSVVGLWRYLSSPISLGIMFENLLLLKLEDLSLFITSLPLSDVSLFISISAYCPSFSLS